MDKPLLLPAVAHRFQQPEGWGTPMPLLHESLADVKEGPLVEKILDDTGYRNMLLNIKGILSNGERPRTEVPLSSFRQDLRGDIDILVLPAGEPTESTAIQVKRFAAKVENDETDEYHVNRFRKLFKKGIDQTDELVRAGFAQVYLWVVLALDTRKQNGGRFVYDGAGCNLRSAISDVISPVRLNPRVGLMSFEFVQPMDRAPLTFGTHGGHLERLAKSVSQPAELTAWLTTLAA
jgi:hypothetical protein